MRTTKKINPTEYRLPINVKPILKVTSTNYNYLLNFHYYLYQLSFYFFKKYGLYFHPYKFLLLESKEIIYLYFIIFKKFKKKSYRARKKSQKKLLKKKFKDNLKVKLDAVANILSLFKMSFFKIQSRRKKVCYVSPKKYKALQFYLFYYLHLSRFNIKNFSKLQNADRLLTPKAAYPSFFVYSRFIAPCQGTVKTSLTVGLKTYKKLYGRKLLKMKKEEQKSFHLKHKNVFFLRYRLLNLLRKLQLKKKLPLLHSFFLKRSAQSKIKLRKINVPAITTSVGLSLKTKVKGKKEKMPMPVSKKLYGGSVESKILSAIENGLTSKLSFGNTDFKTLLVLLCKKNLEKIKRPKIKKTYILVGPKPNLIFNSVTQEINFAQVSPQTLELESIISRNKVFKVLAFKKINISGYFYGLFLKNFYRRLLKKCRKYRKFYFFLPKKKKWLRRRIYKLFLKTKKRKIKRKKTKVRFLNKLTRENLKKKNRAVRILLIKLLKVKKKLVRISKIPKIFDLKKKIFIGDTHFIKGSPLQTKFVYAPPFKKTVKDPFHIKKILKSPNTVKLSSRILYRSKTTFITQNKLELLNLALKSKKKQSNIILSKLKLKFQYLFKLLSRKFFLSKRLYFFLTPLTSFIKLNKNIQKEFLILYKRLRFVKTKRKYYSRLFIFHFVSLYYKNFFLLLPYYKYFLMRKKKQKKFLYKIINLYRAIYYYKQRQILGIQFLMHGTFDRHGRTRKFLYIIGKFKISSLTLPILFDWIDFSSKYGTISLKIWIIYRNLDSKKIL